MTRAPHNSAGEKRILKEERGFVFTKHGTVLLYILHEGTCGPCVGPWGACAQWQHEDVGAKQACPSRRLPRFGGRAVEERGFRGAPCRAATTHADTFTPL